LQYARAALLNHQRENLVGGAPGLTESSSLVKIKSVIGLVVGKSVETAAEEDIRFRPTS
jgi:hypothetical protein